MQDHVTLVLLILWLLFLAGAAVKMLLRYFGPVRTVKAQVVGKYKADGVKTYRGASPSACIAVFEAAGHRRRFRVSAFSYDGYRIGEKGTLKYRGSRLLDFH